MATQLRWLGWLCFVGTTMAMWTNAPLHAQQPVAMTISNTTSAPVEIQWIDEQGASHSYGSIAPGQTITQPSIVGHRWRFVSNAITLGSYVMTTQPTQTVDLGRVSPSPRTTSPPTTSPPTTSPPTTSPLTISPGTRPSVLNLTRWVSSDGQTTVTRQPGNTWSMTSSAGTMQFQLTESGSGSVTLHEPNRAITIRLAATTMWKWDAVANQWQSWMPGSFVATSTLASPTPAMNELAGTPPTQSMPATRKTPQRMGWAGELASPPGQNTPIEFRRQLNGTWIELDSGQQRGQPKTATSRPDGSVFLHDSPGSVSGIHLTNDRATIHQDAGNGQTYYTTWYEGSWWSPRLDGHRRWEAEPGAPTGFGGSFTRTESGQWIQRDAQGRETGQRFKAAKQADGAIYLQSLNGDVGYMLRDDHVTSVRWNAAGQSAESALARGMWTD